MQFIREYLHIKIIYILGFSEVREVGVREYWLASNTSYMLLGDDVVPQVGQTCIHTFSCCPQNLCIAVIHIVFG